MEVNTNLTEKARKDALLVAKVLDSGDRKAYASLMNTYFDQVYTLMLKMSGDNLDAEDLTMEAFSRAFIKLEQYTSDFAFSTWLFRIARNNCIDFLRRRKKEETASGIPEQGEKDHTQATSEIPCYLPGPEQLMINRQETLFLRKIVQGLKPHYKAIIEMHYFQDMKCEEIALELNLPESTVKVRLFRARELLFNILNEE